MSRPTPMSAGMVIPAVWLVWLIPSAYFVVVGSSPLWQKFVGVSLLVAFGAVYLWAFRYRFPQWGWHRACPDLKGRWATLGVVLGLFAATIWLAGAGAVGLIPYICALGVYLFPLPDAVAIVVGCLVTICIAATYAGEFWMWTLVVYCLLLVAAGAAHRWVDFRQDVESEALQRLALTEDRERVARDLHDTLGQSLTLITVKLELAERLFDVDPERSRAELASCQQLTRQALTDVRDTVSGLRVARLEDVMATAVESLKVAGVEANFDGEVSDVATHHRITMSWVVQELVTNVIRHARAHSVSVRWGENWLVVADDGVGMDARRLGNGLAGVRERVEALGGSLEVTPTSADAPRPGTTAKVTL